ncbi:MAG: hypothetical protein WCG85_08915 [Polyangia bacterium]
MTFSVPIKVFGFQSPPLGTSDGLSGPGLIYLSTSGGFCAPNGIDGQPREAGKAAHGNQGCNQIGMEPALHLTAELNKQLPATW